MTQTTTRRTKICIAFLNEDVVHEEHDGNKDKGDSHDGCKHFRGVRIIGVLEQGCGIDMLSWAKKESEVRPMIVDGMMESFVMGMLTIV